MIHSYLPIYLKWIKYIINNNILNHMIHIYNKKNFVFLFQDFLYHFSKKGLRFRIKSECFC